MTRSILASLLVLSACTGEEEVLTVPAAIEWAFDVDDADPLPANGQRCTDGGLDQLVVVWEQSYTEGSRQSANVSCSDGSFDIEMQRWEWTSYGVFADSDTFDADAIELDQHAYGDRVDRQLAELLVLF